MYSKVFSIVLLCFIIGTSACQTKRYTPSDFTESMIFFGSGGGFAGTVTEYCILENGQSFVKLPREEEFSPLYDLEDDVVDQLFANYESLGLSSMKVRRPGNMYYFIKMKKGNEEHQLMWGGNMDELDPKIKIYYDLLNQLVNKQVIK